MGSPKRNRRKRGGPRLLRGATPIRRRPIWRSTISLPRRRVLRASDQRLRPRGAKMAIVGRTGVQTILARATVDRMIAAPATVDRMTVDAAVRATKALPMPERPAAPMVAAPEWKSGSSKVIPNSTK